MSKIRKIRAVLGIKGLLAIASLTSIALALVVYSASVTIAPTSQFTLGVDTADWDVIVNEQNVVRYLPGGDLQPSAPVDISNSAFRVVTDAGETCAVEIGLVDPMDPGLFSNFEIRVSQWVPATNTWAPVQLYDAAVGGTSMTFIDGTTPDEVGYVQQAESSNTYYLIGVTYSYDLVDTLTPITASFQYTPLPT